MSFVFFDVETTGLSRRFDQVVKFAAVRTNSELQEIDRIEVSCQLMPHIIPSGEAMKAAGIRIDQLLDESLPSHYEMVSEIRAKLESWSPAIFLGFNSLSFDEEFLRQALFLNLHHPFLTNTQGNARTDVLNLCRVTAELRPDVISPALNNDNSERFDLTSLAEANQILIRERGRGVSHITTALALCRLVRQSAPEIWSQFLKFSQKNVVESFLGEEEAFVTYQTKGNRLRNCVVTPFSTHSKLKSHHYCLELSADIDGLRNMPDGELLDLLRKNEGPFITIRSNVGPMLWAIDEATESQLVPFTNEAEVLDRAAQIHEDANLLRRIRDLAKNGESERTPSPHLEEQIYDPPFASTHDQELMRDFHSAPWEDRKSLTREFNDQRYRRLALRLIFLYRPDVLTHEERTKFQLAMNQRLMAPQHKELRWRTLRMSREELNTLLSSKLKPYQREILDSLLSYLTVKAHSICPSHGTLSGAC